MLQIPETSEDETGWSYSLEFTAIWMTATAFSAMNFAYEGAPQLGAEIRNRVEA